MCTPAAACDLEKTGAWCWEDRRKTVTREGLQGDRRAQTGPPSEQREYRELDPVALPVAVLVVVSVVGPQVG